MGLRTNKTYTGEATEATKHGSKAMIGDDTIESQTRIAKQTFQQPAPSSAIAHEKPRVKHFEHEEQGARPTRDLSARSRYCTILYYTVLYHTIPYHTILYYNIIYYNILYDITL